MICVIAAFRLLGAASPNPGWFKMWLEGMIEV